MSSQRLAKLSRYIPLWKRKIPAYPLYYPGNPQLRSFLPLFWMKMVKPSIEQPPDTILVEVHPQMTTGDIKQYLEKIYDVPVLNVRTSRKKAEEVYHKSEGYLLDRKIQRKFAHIQLDGKTFEFPEMFGEKYESQEKKDIEQYKEMLEQRSRSETKNWEKRDIPPWFR